MSRAVLLSAVAVVSVLSAVMATVPLCTLSSYPITVAPDYRHTLQGAYTFQVELTNHATNTTYYIHETQDTHVAGGVNAASVRIVTDGPELVYFYFPGKNKFVEYKEGVCSLLSDTEKPFDPWGWLDLSNGGAHYGPSNVLKMAYNFNTALFSSSTTMNNIRSRGFRACPSTTMELDYYFSLAPWAMPDLPYYDNQTSFPVNFVTKMMDKSLFLEYNVIQLLPFVISHRDLDTPRGTNCQSLVGLVREFPPPSMPPHFSFHQEVVVNPMIDGYQSGPQALDQSAVYYSQDLSLIRFDFNPVNSEETPFDVLNPLTVIADYNTGVLYVTDVMAGTCVRARLTPDVLNSHNHGIMVGAGEMVGPDEFMKLTGDYVFVGPYYDRHLKDYRWTSTRSDIVDPQTGVFFPKVVLEWEFLMLTSENTTNTQNIPVRSNVFVYKSADSLELDFMMTTNIADYNELKLHSTDEFNVFECYERSNYDWSYVLIAFPTNPTQMAAASQYPDLVQHQLMDEIIQFGQVSPVRVSNIDISDGFSGLGKNNASSKMLIASVRLLERAPYIYSYSQDTGTTVPGTNEKKVSHIDNVYECAEFCSLDEDMDCLSFQVCDNSDCYLSKSKGQDGPPVAGVVVCEHWVLDLLNVTTVDAPTWQAVKGIRAAVLGKQFNLSLPGEQGNLLLRASELLHYNSPDPAKFLTGQFFLAERHSAFQAPKDTFPKVLTLEDCEEMCVSKQAYRCESIAYAWHNYTCQLSDMYYDDLKDSDTTTRSGIDILTRSYLADYRPVLGGVSLNMSGPVYDDIDRIETCARLCSREDSIDCRSFDLCYSERKCRLHAQGFLDGTTGGNYGVLTSCTHFTKSGESSFKMYDNQALPTAQHRLLLSDSTAATCARLCLDDDEEVCESYDFCEACEADEAGTCGAEAAGLTDVCFVSASHIGEDDVSLLAATRCQHYDREYFGDMSYATWKNAQRISTKAYGSGDMTGLAFGMMAMGVLLVVGFLFGMAHYRNGGAPATSMSFANLKNRAGEAKA